MPAPVGNKYAVGNQGGRPPIYNSPVEFEKRIIEYFEYVKGEYVWRTEEKQVGDKYEVRDWEECVRSPETLTITGLCLFMGFESRQSFYLYEEKQEFCYIVKRARMIIENRYEEALSHNSPTGAIFALKNMGWQDKSMIDHTTKDESLNTLSDADIIARINRIVKSSE